MSALEHYPIICHYSLKKLRKIFFGQSVSQSSVTAELLNRTQNELSIKPALKISTSFDKKNM